MEFYEAQKIQSGRFLRKIAEGETQNPGDTTTLLDPGVVEEIKNGKV